MDYSNNKITESNEDGVNYNPWQRKNRLTTQFSYEETDESLQIRRSWEGVGTVNASYELSDEDHRSLLNLQRLSVEKRRTPFPDFQFELLYNDADTDGSGCELNVATGARKRLTSRGDSLEDNWLFQKRDLKQRPSDTNDFSLALSKNYETTEELTDTEVDDLPRDKTDKSESSEDEWNQARVERPSVHTSSSASGDSESISSDSPAENNDSPENEPDDEVPILGDDNSVNESPDLGQSGVQYPLDYGGNDSEDEDCASEKCGNERDGSDSSPPCVRRKDLEEFHQRLMKNNGADSMSDDDSLKDEAMKHSGERASTSRPVNPLLPMLLARRTPSSCGTRSCDSDDSSSDDFEKKAALYTQRRRASWCYLEKPQPPKRKTKRRPLQQPSLEEEDGDRSLVCCEEGLVGLERQMLHRDVHHSSFRAKKASPNFVLNPLYMPDGEAALNVRRSPYEEPIDGQQLLPPRYESGYSSGSLDSGKNRGNGSPVFEGAGAPGIDRALDRRSNHSNESKSDSSFLW